MLSSIPYGMLRTVSIAVEGENRTSPSPHTFPISRPKGDSVKITFFPIFSRVTNPISSIFFRWWERRLSVHLRGVQGKGIPEGDPEARYQESGTG